MGDKIFIGFGGIRAMASFGKCKRFLRLFIVSCAGLIFISSARAETITIGGTGWSIGIARELATAYMKKHPEIKIVVPDSIGSGGGIKAVLRGRFDVSFSSRPIKKENEGKGLIARPFVKSPFIFVVSPQAGENLSMTKEQVFAAYTGELKSWPNGLPMKEVLRGSRESSTLMLIDKFDGIGPVLKRRLQERGALIAKTDQDALDLGERVPGAIVPTLLLAVQSERRALAPISIDGVAPTLQNMDTGTWDMTGMLYVVEGTQTSATGKAFLKYLFSDETATILQSFGGKLQTN